MIIRAIKDSIIYCLNAIGRLFGKQILVVPSNARRNFVFDANMLSSYWNNEDRIAGYETSLRWTGMEWSDNLSKRGRYDSLYQNTVLAMKTNMGKGDVAECGVLRGHSAHMMAKVLAKHGFTEKFLIFDSFQGLSDITPADKNERFQLSDKQITVQQQMLSFPEEKVRENMAEFDFMEYYAGWIPTRFSEVEDRKFILLHLDTDLYQPIRDSTEFFYPRLVEGGIIAFEAYGLTQFPGAKTAVDEAVAAMKPSFFYKVPTGGAFLIK